MSDHANPAAPVRASGSFAASTRRLRQVGLLIGAALLIAAVVAVAARGDGFAAAARSIADQPAATVAWRVSVIAGTIVANVILTGLLFSLLISRYGRVGLLEMQAVVAATTLINYLPLRPGLFGRLAYHRAMNGIPIADSLKTALQAMALTAATASWLALAAAASKWLGVTLWAPVLAAPAALALVILFGGKGKGVGEVRRAGAVPEKKGDWGTPRFWALAALIRYTEVLLLAARYAAAFALIGSPIDATGALAFGCVGVIAAMVPFVSNGLGLREWAIGLLAPLLASHQMEQGITADLLHRAAELIVITSVGLPAALWLAQRTRKRRLS